MDAFTTGTVKKIDFIERDNNVVPKAMQQVFDDMQYNLAWFAGDQEALKHRYKGEGKHYFWSRVANKPMPAYHLPLPAAISQLASDYLFGEETKFLIKGDGDQIAQAQQIALNVMLDNANMDSLLTESGEIASAAGGVVFKVIVDGELSNRPIIVLVKPDDAIVTFKHGIVTNIRFVHKLDKMNDDRYIWLIEDYNGRGEIVSTIHEGAADGNMTKERPELLERYEIEPVFRTGYDGVAAVYIPNRRPNRKFLASGFGASDYQGVRQMFDSLDETYTSWINDIRLAKGRLHIPETFIDYDDEGNSAFDMDNDIYRKLSGAAAMGDGSADKFAITQFAIRSDDFYKACIFIVQQIITTIGYSTQSFGITSETSQTATESNNRERKSYLTTSKKRRHFERGLKQLIDIMRAVSNEHFGAGFDMSLPVTVDFGDAVESDVSQLATVIDMLFRAQSASIETRVRYFNPSWTDEEVQQEVERIRDENGLNAGSFSSVIDQSGV
ncbi:MAG: phage portal protein [Bdellovibrionales bacterium]|nr:phage portal protein [Bdellovibrionales bacterium]